MVKAEANLTCEMTIGIREVRIGEAEPIRNDLGAAVQEVSALEAILREQFCVSANCWRTVERRDPRGVKRITPRSCDFGDPPTCFVEIDYMASARASPVP